MRVVALIPARYHSTRFPGKPLALLLGKPMILWVAELTTRAVDKSHVFVATDDERIASVVRCAGYQAVMTTNTALTGTDRLAEAADLVEADVYINVQGDEPTLDPRDIVAIREKKIASPGAVINGYCRIAEHEDPQNANIPKVVMTEDERLIYMSRKALPGFKESRNAPKHYHKQVCIYAFSRQELLRFRNFGRKSKLEKAEDIEILRFLDLGIPVEMVQTSGNSLAVDVPEDIVAVERALARIHDK